VPPALTFTVDLEDPSDIYAQNGRYVAMTYRILDMCDELNCKATFFTIGRIATSVPQLLKDIASRGHEIAYHSHNHISLTKEEPARFRRESSEDKYRFEQITGQSVVGFRAPRFSLTPQSLWTLDVLAGLGFRYSSSVMPTDISLFGFPDAPQHPFKWPNGMMEFPLPVANLGKYRLPYLGGIYLYTMPFFIVRSLMTKAKANDVLWTYTHPYDFDREEKFKRMANTPLWISLVLWFARRNASPKIRRLIQMGTSMPLRDRLALLVASEPSSL
jgi:polysaccharide deacetylase family protein (PEP-CTERM system associated)